MNQDACIVFDIDGVLIDTRKSYNESIKQTVQYMVKRNNPTIDNVESLVTDDMIFNFRKSGMFNNDADTSYAFILHRMWTVKNFRFTYFSGENHRKCYYKWDKVCRKFSARLLQGQREGNKNNENAKLSR